MASQRLRQLRVEGDHYSSTVYVIYNDRHPEAIEDDVLDALWTRLESEGWRAASESSHKDGWQKSYTLLAEVADPEPGLLELAGPPLAFPEKVPWESTVVRDGDWLAAGAVTTGAAVVLYQANGAEWRRVDLPDSDRDGAKEMFPKVAMAGGVLLLGSPKRNIVDVWEREGGEWRARAPLRQPTRYADEAFGIEVATDGETVAVNGRLEGHTITFLYRKRGGEWDLAARFPSVEPRVAHALTLTRGWVIAARGTEAHRAGDVVLLRGDGDADHFAGFLSREHLKPEANFGAAVASYEDRLLVTSLENEAGPAAAHFYRLTGSRWIHEFSVETPFLHSGHAAALGPSLAAIGTSWAFGKAGAVRIFAESSGQWQQVQTLTAPGGLFEERFGGSLSINSGTLAVGMAGDGTPRVFLYRARP